MATSMEKGADAVPPNKEQQRQLVLDAIETHLGIKGAPTHYRLFGLADFESDANAIGLAAQATLKRLADKRSEPGVKELIGHATGVARLLLEEGERKKYDETLRAKAAVPAATKNTKAAVQEVIAPAGNRSQPASNVSFMQQKWRELTAAAAIGIGTLAVGTGWLASSGGKETADAAAVKAEATPGKNDAPATESAATIVVNDAAPRTPTPYGSAYVGEPTASTPSTERPTTSGYAQVSMTVPTATKPTDARSTHAQPVAETLSTPSAHPASAYPSEPSRSTDSAASPARTTQTPQPVRPTVNESPVRQAAAAEKAPMTQERREKLQGIYNEALRLEGLLGAKNEIIKGKITPAVIQKIAEKKNLPAIANSPDHRRAHDQVTFMLAHMTEQLDQLKTALEDVRRGDFSDAEENACMNMVKEVALRKGEYTLALSLLEELRQRDFVDAAKIPSETANILIKAPRSKDDAETAKIVGRMLDIAPILEQDNPELFKMLLAAAKGHTKNQDPLWWLADYELINGDPKNAVEKIARLPKHAFHSAAVQTHAVFTEGESADAMKCYELAQAWKKTSDGLSNGRKKAASEISILLARQALTAKTNSSPSIVASAEMLLKHEAPKPPTVAQTPVTPAKTGNTPSKNVATQKTAAAEQPLVLEKPHDGMNLIDIQRDRRTNEGNMSFDAKTGSIAIGAAPKESVRLALPWTIDTSKDFAVTITMKITPKGGSDAMNAYLPLGNGAVMQTNANSYATKGGGYTGLSKLNGVGIDKNPNKFSGKTLFVGQETVVEYFFAQRKDSFELEFSQDGNSKYKEKGNVETLSLPANTTLGRGEILIGGYDREFIISQLQITVHEGSVTPKTPPTDDKTARATRR